MFQPPLSAGSFLVRRVTSVCQSIDCMSTLKPPCSSSCLVTGAVLVSTGRVGRLHQHDRRAVVAGLLQQRLGLLEVRLDQHAVGRFDRIGRAADEGGGADLVVFGLAHRRLEVVLLAHRIERGEADLGIVERLHHMVEADDELVAERVPVEQLDALVLLQDRDQVMRRLLDQVDLAGDDRVHLLLRVGHLDDLDPVDLDHLAAGQARGRLGARLVLRVLEVDVLLAGLRFGLAVDERTGADLAVDLLERVGLGDFFGIMKARCELGLPSESSTRPYGSFSTIWKVLASTALNSFTKSMSLRPIASRAPQRLIEAMQSSEVTGVPSCHSSPSRKVKVHTVLSARDLVLVDHLRLDRVVLVRREQRVVDEVAVVARDVGRRPDRIEDRQVAVLHELQDLALGQRRPGSLPACRTGGDRREVPAS